jgi:hypothetical protein
VLDQPKLLGIGLGFWVGLLPGRCR